MSLKKPFFRRTRRGDTLIEVMFALAVFSMVALISVSMMNGGVAQAERALENVVARNELNAQAEALRFVHSSYISEQTLPEYSTALPAGEKYQQYKALWEKIVENAITPQEANDNGILDLAGTVHNASETGVTHGCERVYESNASSHNLLYDSKAFVLNTRNLSSIDTATHQTDVNVSYISAMTADASSIFTPAPLNARIIFGPSVAASSDDADADEPATPATPTDSTTQFTDGDIIYNRVQRVEGIWVVAVTDNNFGNVPSYYDFYIESCWYGPGATVPTSLDTVIRLYNPDGVTTIAPAAPTEEE